MTRLPPPGNSPSRRRRSVSHEVICLPATESHRHINFSSHTGPCKQRFKDNSACVFFYWEASSHNRNPLLGWAMNTGRKLWELHTTGSLLMWGWRKWPRVHGPVCSAGWNTAAYEATLGSLIPMWKGQSTSRLQNELLLSTQDPTDSLLGWGWNTGLKQRQRQYGRLEVGSQAEVRWEVGGGRTPKPQMQLYSLPPTRTRLLPPTSVCYCPPKRLQNVCHTQFSKTANGNTHVGSFYLNLLSSNCMEGWVMFWKRHSHREQKLSSSQFCPGRVLRTFAQSPSWWWYSCTDLIRGISEHRLSSGGIIFHLVSGSEFLQCYPQDHTRHLTKSIQWNKFISYLRSNNWCQQSKLSTGYFSPATNFCFCFFWKSTAVVLNLVLA